MHKKQKLIAFIIATSIATSTFTPLLSTSEKKIIRKQDITDTIKKHYKTIAYASMSTLSFLVGAISALSSFNSYRSAKNFGSYHLQKNNLRITINVAIQQKIMSILKAQFSVLAFLASLYAFKNAHEEFSKLESNTNIDK